MKFLTISLHDKEIQIPVTTTEKALISLIAKINNLTIASKNKPKF